MRLSKTSKHGHGKGGNVQRDLNPYRGDIVIETQHGEAATSTKFTAGREGTDGCRHCRVSLRATPATRVLLKRRLLCPIY